MTFDPVKESVEEKQLRLSQEQMCRKLADGLKALMPPGHGFMLFIANYGEGESFDSMSYVASVERADARRLAAEWLHKTGGLDQAIADYVYEQVAKARAGGR